MDENRKRLYDRLSVTYDMGTFDEFDTDLDNEDNQKVAWEAVGGQDGYGDFAMFQQAIARSPQAAETGSAGNTENTGSADAATKAAAAPMMEAQQPDWTTTGSAMPGEEDADADISLPDAPNPGTPKDQSAGDRKIVNESDGAAIAPAGDEQQERVDTVDYSTLSDDELMRNMGVLPGHELTQRDIDGRMTYIASIADPLVQQSEYEKLDKSIGEWNRRIERSTVAAREAAMVTSKKEESNAAAQLNENSKYISDEINATLKKDTDVDMSGTSEFTRAMMNDGLFKQFNDIIREIRSNIASWPDERLRQELTNRTFDNEADSMERAVYNVAIAKELEARSRGGHATTVGEDNFAEYIESLRAQDPQRARAIEAHADGYDIATRGHASSVQDHGDAALDDNPSYAVPRIAFELLKLRRAELSRRMDALKQGAPGGATTAAIEAMGYSEMLTAEDYEACFRHAEELFGRDKIEGYNAQIMRRHDETMGEAVARYEREVMSTFMDIVSDDMRPKNNWEYVFGYIVHNNFGSRVLQGLHGALHGAPKGLDFSTVYNSSVEQYTTANSDGAVNVAAQVFAPTATFLLGAGCIGEFFVPNIVGRWTSNFALRAVGGGTAAGMRSMAQKGIVKYGTSMLSTGTNFAAFGLQNELIHQLSTGDVEGVRLLVATLEEGLKGAAFGTATGIMGKLFERATGWKAYVGEAAKIGVEAAAFTGMGYLEARMNGKDGLTLADVGTNIGIVAGSKMSHFKQWSSEVRQRARNEGIYGRKVNYHEISEREREQLESLGYHGVAIALKGSLLSEDQARAIDAELSQMRNDKNVPWELVRCADWVLNGRMSVPPAVADARVDGDAVNGYVITAVDSTGRAIRGGVTVKGNDAKNAMVKFIKKEADVARYAAREQKMVEAQSARDQAMCAQQFCAMSDGKYTDVGVVLKIFGEALRKNDAKEKLGDVEEEVLTGVGVLLAKMDMSDIVGDRRKQTEQAYKVNLDKAIKKDASERTDAEKAAVKDYDAWLDTNKDLLNLESEQFAEWLRGAGTDGTSPWSSASGDTSAEARGWLTSWSDKIDTSDLVIVESIDQVADATVREAIKASEREGRKDVPGWSVGGKAYVYLPHIGDKADFDKTVMHELVAHRGLRGLLGENRFNDLCDRVWNSMSAADRARLWNYPSSELAKNERDRQRAVADEYIAQLSERTDAEGLHLWNKFVALLYEHLHVNIMGTGLDAQLREDIRESYRNLREGRDGGAADGTAEAERGGEGEPRKEGPISEGEPEHIHEDKPDDGAVPPDDGGTPPPEGVAAPPAAEGGETPAGGEPTVERPTSAVGRVDGTPAHIYDWEQLLAENDAASLPVEKVQEGLELMEREREQAHRYANGELADEPSNWEYWATRDGLSEPTRQAEPVATEPPEGGIEQPAGKREKPYRTKDTDPYGVEYYGYDDSAYDKAFELEKEHADELDKLEGLNDEEYESAADEIKRKLPHGFDVFYDKETGVSHIEPAEPTRYGVGNLHETNRKFKIGEHIQLNFYGRHPHVIVTRINENGKVVEAIDAEDGRTIIRDGEFLSTDEVLAQEKRISSVKDQNGKPFMLSSDGTIDIAHISAEHNLPEGAIRLSVGDIENGYIHIEKRHGEEIRKAGFSDVLSFIEYIAKNFNQIKRGDAYKNEKGGENTTYLVQLTDGHNNTLFVQLSRDGSYWNINSAGVFSKKYGKNKETIWSASEVQNNGSATDNASLNKPNAEKGDITNGTASTSVSSGKGSDNISSVQEDGQKKLPKGANAEAETMEPSELPMTEHIATMVDAWGPVTRVEIVGQNDNGTTRVRLWFKNRDQRGVEADVDLRGPQPPETPTPPAKPTGDTAAADTTTERPAEVTSSADDQQMNDVLSAKLGEVDEEAERRAAQEADPYYMPMENKGGGRMSPNYRKATAEQIFNHLNDRENASGRDTLDGNIADGVKRAEDKLKAVERREPKGKGRSDAALDKWEKELSEARAQLEKWREVERMRQEQKTAEGDDSDPTWKQAYDAYTSSDEYPSSLEDYVARHLYGTKFKWKDKELERTGGRTHGLGGHLGLGKSEKERRGFFGWIDEKNGSYPESVAEGIHANMPDWMRDRYDTMEVLDAVLSVVGGNPRPRDMVVDYAKRLREQSRDMDEYYADEAAGARGFADAGEMDAYDNMREREATGFHDVAAAGREADGARADLLAHARARLSDPNASEYEKQAARTVLRFRQRGGRDGDTAQGTEGDGMRYRIRTKEPPKKTRKVYKLMRLGEDGKLYPLFIDSASPVELGTWYDADSPNLDFLRTLTAGVHLVNAETGESMTLEQFSSEHPELKIRGSNPNAAAIDWATANGMRWMKVVSKDRGQRRYGGELRSYYNYGINGSGAVETYALRPGWHAASLPTMRQIGKGPNKNLRDNRFVWVEGEVAADVDYQGEADANPDKDIPDRIPEDGYYLKATNADKAKSQADRVGWFVSGAFKANRIISDAEARRVIDQWNAEHPDQKVEYDYERESGVEFSEADAARVNGETAESGGALFRIRDDERRPTFYSNAERAVIKAYGGSDDAPNTPDGGGVRFRTRDDADMLVDMAKHNNEVARQRRDAVTDFVKAITDVDELTDSKFATALGKVMRGQRQYDQATVADITTMVKAMMDAGLLTELDNFSVKQILTKVKDSTGKNDITAEANKLIDIMLKHQLKKGKQELDKSLKVTGQRVDSRGVVVQAGLDPHGQLMVAAFKEGMKLDEQQLDEQIAKAQNDMSSSNQPLAADAAGRYDGLLLARQHLLDIRKSEADEVLLKNQLTEAKELHKAGMIDDATYKQLVESINDQLRDNKFERIEAYNNLQSALGYGVAQSVEASKQWRESNAKRVGEIQHNANSDLEGVPTSEFSDPSRWGRFANNIILRFLNSSLPTFDFMLRFFGSKNVRGEGYLFNRFMRGDNGYIKSSDRAARGEAEAMDALSKKASELFGKKMRFVALGSLDRKLPKVSVEFLDGGEMKPHELTQGQVVYMYMVNKMADGRQKLRAMGITQEAVDSAVSHVDQRLVKLADWIQDEFNEQLHNKYNAVHQRVFGSPLTHIANYFPLRVNSRSRLVTVDNANDGADGNNRPSTITGGIIKRTRNSYALDLPHNSFVDVMQQHISEMEHWAAFAEFNRDINTLLSYKNFRNKVANMTSFRYGSGNRLLEKFEKVAALAGGSYRPAVKESSIDNIVTNIVKGLTVNKIAFRLHTALKQLESGIVYLSEANPADIMNNMLNLSGSWNWAIENLPGFTRRWVSRTSGDYRLRHSELDWKVFNQGFIEKLNRWGMTPNAFVDAMTVAVGARSIYDSRFAKHFKDYLDSGLSQEDAYAKAHDKALMDATTSFNETQQSSEEAFVSTIQADRTVASAALTAFRNASMGYQRRLGQAYANLARRLRKGYKEQSIEFMTKQGIRDGLSADVAERAAKRAYRNGTFRDIADVALFGFFVQFGWNMMNNMYYQIFGDDDEEKKEARVDAAWHSLYGGQIEGLAGGNILSDIIHMKSTGQNVGSYNFALLPFVSDMQSMLRKTDGSNPRYIEAATDAINILIGSGTGVNPQVLTDAIVAGFDACEGDLAAFHETMWFLSRLLQVPQSEQKKFLVDRIGKEGADGKPLSLEQVASRYGRYVMRRNAPLGSLAYDGEQEIELEKRYAKQIEDAARKRDERLNDEEFAQKLRELEDKGLDTKGYWKDFNKRAGVDSDYGKPDKDASAQARLYYDLKTYEDHAGDVAVRRRKAKVEEWGKGRKEKGLKRKGDKWHYAKDADRKAAKEYFDQHRSELEALAKIEYYESEADKLKKKLTAEGADQKDIMRQIRELRNKILAATDELK